MQSVILRHVAGFRRACTRELRGLDEQLVNDTSTATAIGLLDQVLVSRAEGDLPPGHAADLTASERDALLAALYVQTFGPQVQSTITCGECESPYDIDFALMELMASLRATEGGIEVTAKEEGSYVLPGGARFRLLTGRDELNLSGVPREQVVRMALSRCIIEGDPERDGARVQNALARLSPIAEKDMDAPCPECGHAHSVHFSLQSYFLTALRNERQHLVAEVHRLARAYGWSLTEILGIPRSQRKAHITFIEAESS